MLSGDEVKSLKRLLPRMRSRITRSVQRSPTMSRAQATGQGERRGVGVLVLDFGEGIGAIVGSILLAINK